MPISLDGKKGRNRGAFDEKASFKAVFLILLLHNPSEDVFLLLSLHPQIISSRFRFSVAKLCIGVFGEDNAGKSRRDDLRCTSADKDGGIKADNPGIGIDADAGIDNLDTAADNSGTATNNLGITIDNLGIVADNLDTAADNLGTAVNNPDTRIDADTRVDNPSTAASNKACTVSFFAFYYAFFLLTSSSKLVTVSLPSSLPSSSSITLWSKPILLYSVTSMKQRALLFKYPMDEM